MTLPIMLSLIVGSLLSGPAVSFFGYYKPFMVLGCILMSIGIGFMTTFEPDTGHPEWIGYQVLLGLGGGISFQQPLIAAQVVLSEKDLPIGTAAVTFAQTFGGAVSISIAQAIFTNKLVSGLKSIPQVNPRIVQDAGATNLKNSVDPRYLARVITVYSKALTESYCLAVAFASFLIVGAVGVEWKSVKEDKKKTTDMTASVELAGAIHHA